ncbi:hypothetical protein BDW22DRAFT_1090336 [Trametopsis cervina]|nr:hypothetical protein BDW22DRAFT_1090336 [Trametopsis cervina]
MNHSHPVSTPTKPDRLPLSSVRYIVLPLLALSVLVSIKLNRTLRLAGLAAYVAWSLHGTRFTAGGGYEDYLKGAFLGATSLVALYDLVLTDPLTEWTHKSEPGCRLIDMPVWKRVYWVVCAALDNRGIGWSFEVPYVPPLPSHDRWMFLKRRSRQLLWNLFLVDLAQTYERLNPVFAPSSTAGMWSQGLLLGYLNLVARLTVAWGMFNIPYDWLSLACVASGFHEPQDWPDTFGKWSDAYTVRRFWSRCWHQRLRRYTAATGKAAARLLNCKPGTWLSARVQLIFGFGISALAHLPGDLMVSPRYAGASAPFFLWQILAITLEDFVIDLSRYVGVEEGKAWGRVVGWVWTAGWFSVMVGKFIDWTFLAGAGMHETFRFSVVRPMLDYALGLVGTDLVSCMSRVFAS